MKTWEAQVLIKGVPTPMRIQANNAVVARSYFENFGKIVSELRIV